MSQANAQRPGLRERNRQSKEGRIREAARDLFLECGFEDTTLRQVADRADVGFGTVFAYANDKAGLLAMVFVEELKALPRLFGTVESGEPFDELIEALGNLYSFWARTPGLSYHVLRQLEFYSDNVHVSTIIERRRETRDEIARWVERHQASGVFSTKVDASNAAATLFAIYTSAVREWSAGDVLDVAEGIAELRLLMLLPARGLEVLAS